MSYWRKRSTRICVFALAVFAVVLLNYLLPTHKYSPVSMRITDQCPTQKRPVIIKIPSTYQINGSMRVVINEPFLFRFSFPDKLWRFEENTLQDFDEPISTPGYYYSFLLTYSGTSDASRRSPADIRMLVYPALCNSPNQWAQFFTTQGWGTEIGATFAKIGIPWTILTRKESGRNTHMFLTDRGVFQYVFVYSWDSGNPEVLEEDMLNVVKSFQFEKGVTDDTK
jgi:hypothetical protein